MLLPILSSLALAISPAPVTLNHSAHIIGCHPQPGKVMGCATNSHTVAQQRAMGTYQPTLALADHETVERTMACHPDPSRNRGCFRPAPGARVKPALAAKTAATAQADPAPTPSPEASGKSS